MKINLELRDLVSAEPTHEVDDGPTIRSIKFLGVEIARVPESYGRYSTTEEATIDNFLLYLEHKIQKLFGKKL